MYEFSREYRLVSKHDFQFVFAKPTKVTYKYLLVLHRPNLRDHARLGLIIAKHHVKLAVDRNRLRRHIRESFRYRKETLKGLDIIVLMRSKCTPLDQKMFRDDINIIWQKLATP